MNQIVYTTGLSLGNALAVCISWEQNHSVIWGTVHGLFSWAYVVYYLIFG